jgi:hypothetical protein
MTAVTRDDCTLSTPAEVTAVTT